MIFKKVKFIKKCKRYAANWDTERYGFVQVTDDGRLIRTNNKDIDGLYLNKNEFFSFVSVIQNNT